MEIKYVGGGLPLHGSASASDGGTPYHHRRSCICGHSDELAGSALEVLDVDSTPYHIKSRFLALVQSGYVFCFLGASSPIKIDQAVPVA
jgi:hypothetical protein